MFDFHKEIIKKIDDNLDFDDTVTFIDTGCYILNGILSSSIYGGLPRGRITALAGEESTGKSFIAISIVKNFLEKNPKGYVIYLDSEMAQSKQDFKDRGVDVSRCSILKIATVEEFRNKCIDALNLYKQKVEDKDQSPLLIVLDSMGQLVTEATVTKTDDGTTAYDQGLHSKLLKQTFARLTHLLGICKATMIVANHVYTQPAVNPKLPPKKILSGRTTD